MAAMKHGFARAALLACLAHLALIVPGGAAGAFEPELIERLIGAIDDHTLVMLDGSRVLVAWERDDGPSNESVWASRRAASGAWSVPEVVEFAQGHARDVQLAVDGDGAAMVVWVQEELKLSGLWANRYLPGEGWRDPTRIEPVAGEIYAPRLALDRAGRGFAVWERRQGERLRIRAGRFTAQAGWETPRDVDAGEGDALAPRLALRENGDAVAAWTVQSAPGRRRIVARHYSASGGWAAPRDISVPGADAYDVELAMDAQGNAFAAWTQSAHGARSVHASRYQAGVGWGVPMPLDIVGAQALTPRLAVSADGNAMVAWIRAEGETGEIVAARYTGEFLWGRPVVVQGGGMLRVFDLDVTAGTDGEVLATWCQIDGSRNNVWYARFDGRSQWQRPALAEHRTGSAHDPRAAAAADGSFGLLWKMVDAPLPEQAIYSLWFRRVQ